MDERPSYGYRRVTARLNRERPEQRVNHKRVYRVMKQAGLLLPKHTGKPPRPHKGRIITLASDMRQVLAVALDAAADDDSSPGLTPHRGAGLGPAPMTM